MQRTMSEDLGGTRADGTFFCNARTRKDKLILLGTLRNQILVTRDLKRLKVMEDFQEWLLKGGLNEQTQMS